MAIQVPRYDSQQVQERLTPQVNRSVNAPIEAFGGGQALAPLTQGVPAIAKGIDQLNQTNEGIANSLAAEEKAKANQLRMLEKRRELWDFERTNIYDPENGAINKCGKDALGLQKTLGESYEKFVQEQMKDLANDEQKAAFEQMAQSRRESIFSWAAGHEAQQAKVLEESEFESSLESSKERGATDPKNIGIESAFLKQQIGIKAEKEGWGAERIKQELQKQETDLLGRTIEGMLAKGNDLGAQGFFSKVKDRIDPDVRSKIEASLQEGSTRGESQRITDKLLTEYSDLGAAREAIREIKDPKLRDAVDERAKMEFALRANEDSARRDQNFMDAYAIVEQSKKADNIPPALYNQLTPSQRTSIRTLEKQVNGVVPQKQDDKVYLEYLGMPIQQIARVSEAQLIEKVRPNVSEASFKEIARRWEAAREGTLKGKKDKEAEFKSLYSDDEIIFNGLKKAGVAGLTQTDTMGKLDETKATAVAEFRDRFNTRMQAYFHETGKNPGDEVKQKIMREMVKDRVFVKESSFGIDAFAKDREASGRELTPEERARSYVPIERIPRESLDFITKKLKSDGKRISNDKIQRIYAAAASGDDELVKKLFGE